jgi:hypothetical protein
MAVEFMVSEFVRLRWGEENAAQGKRLVWECGRLGARRRRDGTPRLVEIISSSPEHCVVRVVRGRFVSGASNPMLCVALQH